MEKNNNTGDVYNSGDKKCRGLDIEFEPGGNQFQK